MLCPRAAPAFLASIFYNQTRKFRSILHSQSSEFLRTMNLLKPSSRYSSFDSRSSISSQLSDHSPTVDSNKTKTQSSMKRLTSKPSSNPRRPPNSASAIDNLCRTLPKPNEKALSKVKKEHNFSGLVKKFMETKSRSKSKAVTALDATKLFIPADFVADDLKKTARRGSNLTTLHRKLFHKGSGSSSRAALGEMKALTEIKSNTRTLAMVLKSERELLGENKELEMEIKELKLALAGKNNEVEKLKDLCLKQRAEIKALKTAVLFPDEINPNIGNLLDRHNTELTSTNEIIPKLQMQVTSLTGQLQCLAEDLAEVKAEKSSSKSYSEAHYSSPRTPQSEQERTNSLEFRSEDHPTTPCSYDDMLLNDWNPCLTPCSDKVIF